MMYPKLRRTCHRHYLPGHLRGRNYAGIFYSLFVFLSAWLSAYAQKPYTINGTPGGEEGVNIEEDAAFFVDKSRLPLTFRKIQKQKFLPFSLKHNERATDSDVTDIRIWARFKITNKSLTDTARLNLLPGAHHKVFLYQNDQLIARAGVTFSDPKAVLNPVYMPFSVAPGSTATFYVQVIDHVTSIMPVLVILHTRHSSIYSMVETSRRERLLFLMMSIFVGCLLFMTIYSVYHYWLTRDSMFAWYSLYVGSAMVVSLLGLEDRFEYPLLSSLLNVASDKSESRAFGFYFLVPAFYIIFIARIIDLKTHQPKIWFVLKIIFAALLVQQLLTFYQVYTQDYFYHNTYYLNQFLSFPLSSLVLLYATIRSNSPVKYYLIAGLATFLLLIWAPLYVNYFNDSVSLDPQTETIVNLPLFWIFLGFVVEALCFSLALAYRNRLVEIEKNTMQVRYAERLETELDQRTGEIQAQNALMEQQKIRQLQTDFDQKLAETEMTALRAQMNPHFIFNCLNSIKLYTLKNDALTAANYLTRFSRLIRLVLENSRSEKVTLANELEILEIYLEMESMRFKNKVQYQINVAENVDTQYIEIPPLILQPYVENAIWHGLMHRKTGGNVTIDVAIPQEQTLKICITDDGIGRAAASEIKSKSATRDKSFGMKMTTERIGLINQLYQSNTAIMIEDLKNEKGEAAGTRVIIEIAV